MENALQLVGRALVARSSRQVPAVLVVGPVTAQLVDENGDQITEFPLGDLKFDAPLGKTDRRANLPDGTLFETNDHAGVKQITGDNLGDALSDAERFSPRLILGIAAALIGVFAIWKYALPILVWIAVALTPDPIRNTIDAGGMRAIDLTIAAPTKIASTRQAEVQLIFNTLIAAIPADPNEFQLEFRALPGVGPNAMALPGGTILVTDALLDQFPNDDVIAAVLGHELGHVVEDHGLTQLYRSLGIYVLVALVAGDTGPILEDLILEGGVILSLSFSREHEQSADQFGLNLTDRAGYDPAGLIEFFQTLPDSDETESGWASTHPSSGARIGAIKKALAASKKHQTK